MIRATCIFVALLGVPTHEQESPNSTLISPCPDLFTYEPPGSEPGRWYGVVNLTTDITLHSLWLNIVLDCKADKLETFVGDVTTRDNMYFKIENTNIQIDSGSAMVVRFSVQYNPQNQTPRLQAIRLNGTEICSSLTVQSLGPVSLEISKTRIIQLYNKVGEHRGASDQKQCGFLYSEDLWPWQVALYKVKKAEEYACGGTLVSHRHVITAAQCVTRKSSSRPINKYILMAYLGKHNLWTSIEGVQIRFVENILIHEEYNSSSFRHNVAILKLREPVTYTNWVRAACLWPEIEEDLKYVTGRKGWLLDWGLDKEGVVIQELSSVEMPVVSQESCISSHHELFETHISNFTYCATNEKGCSFCPVNSGGGMVFMMGNTWYLRGLVSVFPRDPDQARCDDPIHYFLFMDLAKYLAWIRLNLQDH